MSSWFKIGFSEDEDLTNQIEAELKGVIKNLLGWPGLLVQFQASLELIRNSQNIDQGTKDNFTKVVASMMSWQTDWRKNLEEYATILATYQSTQSTKRLVRLNGLLAGATVVLALATLGLALSSLFQVHL